MKYLSKLKYYGIELEILFPTIDDKKLFKSEYQKVKNLGEVKKERSIDSKLGLEIALPPLTLKEIEKHKAWNLLEKYNAYIDDSCGVHISLPREYFKESEWHKFKEYWDDLIDEQGRKMVGRWISMYNATHDYEEWCGKRGSISWLDERRIEIRSFSGTTRLETILKYIKNINIAIENFLNNRHKKFVVIDHKIEDRETISHENIEDTQKRIKKAIKTFEKIIDNKYNNKKILITIHRGLEIIRLLTPRLNEQKERIHNIINLEQIIEYSQKVNINNLPVDIIKNKVEKILNILNKLIVN